MTTKRSIRDLERELKKEPANLALRLQLAAAYREGLRSLEALDLYRSVARAYAEQGRHGQAAMVCRSALEIAPEDSELYGMLMHLERSSAATIAPPLSNPSGRPPTMPPLAGMPGPSSPPAPSSATGTSPVVHSPPVTAQPGASPSGGTVSRTRVLPAEVSVRELGSVAATVKHSAPPAPAAPPPAEPARPARPAGGPPPGSFQSSRKPTPTPTQRVSTLDVPTPLPDPLPLHETTGRDSLIDMAELIGRPTPTPAPMRRKSPRPPTDEDSETVIPLTQVRAPTPSPSSPGPSSARPGPPPPPSSPSPPQPPPPPPPGRPALPRITSQTRPPPNRPPQSQPPRPPPPRAVSASDDSGTRTDVSPRPSEGDFSSDMQTRKRPKLSANDLAMLDLERVEAAPDAVTNPGSYRELADDPDHDLHDHAPTTARMPPMPDPGDPADPAYDDEPTHPPGMTPSGMVPGGTQTTAVTAAPEGVRDTRTDVRVEPGRDTTMRGESSGGRSATGTEEVTQGTFDQSFDATLSALGPDGLALEGPLGVFSMLPPEAAAELAQRAVVKQYAVGEVVIREGDPGDACYVIVHGEVAVHKRAPEGGELIELARLSDGSLFGEFALLADRRRHATVVATTEAEIYEIPRLLLRELAAIFPEVGPALETFYRERLVSNLLFTTPLFALVSDDQRPPLLSRFHPLHAESGQPIVRQGERAGGLYLIVLGAVEVVRRTGDRSAVVLATLGEGSYFGEMSLLSGEMASASVVAAGPCELAVLPPRDFYEVVAANPELWSAMRREADARRLANAQILAGHTGIV